MRLSTDCAHFVHTCTHLLGVRAPGYEDHTLRPWDMSFCLRRRKSRRNYLENRCRERLPAFVRVRAGLRSYQRRPTQNKRMDSPRAPGL